MSAHQVPQLPPPAPKLHVDASPEKAGGSYQHIVLEKSLAQCADGSSGFNGLAKFLMAADAALVDARVVERKFGIPTRNLARALRSPACRDIAATYGWSVCKAKEVGKPGRGNWLVNWQRLANHAVRQNAELTAT